MVVFFDIIYKDGCSYLEMPYDSRHEKLIASVSCRPGHAILADRSLIPADRPSQSVFILRDMFASHIANHKEGLVLKAAESLYHDWKLPWVKVNGK
jgi:DNA ligase-4